VKRFLVVGVAICLVALVAVNAFACGGEEQETTEAPITQQWLEGIRKTHYASNERNAEHAYFLVRGHSKELPALGVDAEELVKLEELARVWAVSELERSRNAFQYYTEKQDTLTHKEHRQKKFAASRLFRYSEFLGVALTEIGLTPEAQHEFAHILSRKLKRDFLSCEKFKETENDLYAVLDQHPDRAHFLETEHPSNYKGWDHVSEAYLIDKQALLCGSS